jgi:kumamolisin
VATRTSAPPSNTKLPGTDTVALPPTYTRLPDPDPDEQITVSVIIRSPWWVELPSDEAIFELLTSKPLKDRPHLSARQYIATYGADPMDVTNVTRWAKKVGLTVKSERSAHTRCRVTLGGTVAQMSKAFGTQLATYKNFLGETGRLRIQPIHVPECLAEVIVGVFGLSNLPLGGRQQNDLAQSTSKPGASWYPPQQFAQLYNFPQAENQGAGQEIAIFEFGGGFSEDVVAETFGAIGIGTPPKIEGVGVGTGANRPGLPGGPPQGVDLEVLMDLLIVGAIVPQAKIRVYFAEPTHRGWVDALMDAILREQTTVISISWGDFEGSFGKQSITQIERLLRIAALRGITVCCASGDHGTTNATDMKGGDAHLWYPASSPYVLSCGGTKVTVKGGRIAKEVVWNEGWRNLSSGLLFWATGGGVSEIHPVPVWQKKATKATVSVNTGKRGRGVPDVAGNAAVSWKIGDTLMGGTSAVAPLWAGLVALLNDNLGRRGRAGFVNHLLYEAAFTTGKGFNPVTSGSNDDHKTARGYSAGYWPWNACTGLGSPNGDELRQALNL